MQARCNHNAALVDQVLVESWLGDGKGLDARLYLNQLQFQLQILGCSLYYMSKK